MRSNHQNFDNIILIALFFILFQILNFGFDALNECFIDFNNNICGNNYASIKLFCQICFLSCAHYDGYIDFSLNPGCFHLFYTFITVSISYFLCFILRLFSSSLNFSPSTTVLSILSLSPQPVPMNRDHCLQLL